MITVSYSTWTSHHNPKAPVTVAGTAITSASVAQLGSLRLESEGTESPDLPSLRRLLT